MESKLKHLLPSVFRFHQDDVAWTLIKCRANTEAKDRNAATGKLEVHESQLRMEIADPEDANPRDFKTQTSFISALQRF